MEGRNGLGEWSAVSNTVVWEASPRRQPLTRDLGEGEQDAQKGGVTKAYPVVGTDLACSRKRMEARED